MINKMKDDKTTIKDHLSDLHGKHSWDETTEEQSKKGKGVMPVDDVSEG